MLFWPEYVADPPYGLGLKYNMFSNVGIHNTNMRLLLNSPSFVFKSYVFDLHMLWRMMQLDLLC